MMAFKATQLHQSKAMHNRRRHRIKVSSSRGRDDHPPPTTGTVSNKKEPLQAANTFCRETEFFIPKFPFFSLRLCLSFFIIPLAPKMPALSYSLSSLSLLSLLSIRAPSLQTFSFPLSYFLFVHSDGPACLNLTQLGFSNRN